jgi:hypothetical protein
VRDVSGFADGALWSWWPAWGEGRLNALKGGTLDVQVRIVGLPEQAAFEHAKTLAAKVLGGSGSSGFAYDGAAAAKALREVAAKVQSPVAYRDEWFGQEMTFRGTVAKVDIDFRRFPQWLTISSANRRAVHLSPVRPIPIWFRRRSAAICGSSSEERWKSREMWSPQCAGTGKAAASSFSLPSNIRCRAGRRSTKPLLIRRAFVACGHPISGTIRRACRCATGRNSPSSLPPRSRRICDRSFHIFGLFAEHLCCGSVRGGLQGQYRAAGASWIRLQRLARCLESASFERLPDIGPHYADVPLKALMTGSVEDGSILKKGDARRLCISQSAPMFYKIQNAPGGDCTAAQVPVAASLYFRPNGATRCNNETHTCVFGSYHMDISSAGGRMLRASGGGNTD